MQCWWKFRIETDFRSVFKRIDQKVREFGHLNINNLDRGRPRNNDHVERDEEVLQLVQENRNISIRQLSSIVGTSNTTICRTLHNENMHPYHYTQSPALLP
jgi:predicted HTH transcriptional regulator